MKTIISIFLLAVLALGSVSCISLKSGMFSGNEYEIAKNTGEKIVAAIQDHNSIALKEMFSVNASNEVSDLDEAAEKMIEFIKVILYHIRMHRRGFT